MTTLIDVIGSVRLAAQDGSDTRWAKATKTAAINETLADFYSVTEIARKYCTLAQSAGGVYIPATADRLVRVLSLQSATVGGPITASNPAELYAAQATWDTQTGNPRWFIFPYELSAGVKTLRVVPFPAPADAWEASTAYIVGDYVYNGSYTYVCDTAGTSAGSGGPTGTSTNITDGTARWDYYSDSTSIALSDLKAWASIIPADLSADADVVNLPPEYIDCIADGATAYLFREAGAAEDLQRAGDFWNAYAERREECRRKVSADFQRITRPVATEWF